MVELSISDRDADLILSALSFFDDEVLPHSVPRITLYELLKYIQETFGFEGYERHVQMAEESLSGEVRILNLSTDAADYVERALWCAISLGSCTMEELDSEYAECFILDLKRLCSVEMKLRDAIGPHCFVQSAENKKAWDEVFGVSEATDA